MDDNPRRDREAIYLAILIGVFSALVILLAVVLLARTGGDDAPDSTVAAPATTAATTTTTLQVTTTDAPTTTAIPTTTGATTTTTPATTTTTEAPFVGDTDWKGCAASGSSAGTVSDIRFAQRDGFTRVVFDFTGGIPACNVGYADPHTIAVIVHPIDIANPFAPGIFDGSGQLQVGTISVNRVGGGGMGGGSGEWEFSIDVAGTRPFNVFTLESPSRLAIDIED